MSVDVGQPGDDVPGLSCVQVHGATVQAFFVHSTTHACKALKQAAYYSSGNTAAAHNAEQQLTAAPSQTCSASAHLQRAP